MGVLSTIFTEARKTLNTEENWCRGAFAFDIYERPTYARDSIATRWSLAGACHLHCDNPSTNCQVNMILFKELGMPADEYNDTTGYKRVVAVLDRMVARFK